MVCFNGQRYRADTLILQEKHAQSMVELLPVSR